jgi:hypothetical protein
MLISGGKRGGRPYNFYYLEEIVKFSKNLKFTNFFPLLFFMLLCIQNYEKIVITSGERVDSRHLILWFSIMV